LQRLLTSATLVALLVATAAAFAITERLKLTKSAVYGTQISKTFSPTCGCQTDRAKIHFVLRRPDTVDVNVIDGHGREVTFLAAGEPYRRGPATFRWDGTTSAGTRAPDGLYKVKIHLARQHTTYVLPNTIRLDTQAPKVVDVTQNRDTFSPDHDKQADYVRFSYKLSKPAQLILYLDGRQILKTHFHPVQGRVLFYGVAHGHRLQPGDYTLEVGAVDLAGNRTAPPDRVSVRVTLRYITLASRRIVVRAGGKIAIGVSTDALHYIWQLGQRKGRTHGPVLRVRAPGRPGLYTLTVTERGHVDRAHVVVK